MIKLFFKIAIVFTSVLFISNCIAQSNLAVDIVKSYEPIIPNSYKINLLPKIKDTVEIRPVFKYSIEAKPLFVAFQPTSITPARIINEPLKKLYKSYIKLGYGNYNSPFGELFINSLYSNNYVAGAYLNHYSSSAKMKYNENQKVFSGFSDNSADIFCKRFYKNATFYGNTYFSRNVNYFYGINPFIDTVINKKDIKQYFLDYKINLNYKTNYLDSNHFNYTINTSYGYFADKYNFVEHGILAKANVNRYSEKVFHGGNADVALFFPSDTFATGLVTLNPYINITDSSWRVLLGVNIDAEVNDGLVNYYFFPNILMQYNIIEHFLIPYFGTEHKIQLNNYATLAKENPFIMPGLFVNSTRTKTLFAGFRGHFSSRTSFNIKASYNMVTNAYFYINDTSNLLQNQFIALSDNLDLFNIYGEIAFKRTEKINFMIKANYYNYDLRNELHAWHKPDYDITLHMAYNLKSKIYIKADLFTIGTRYAKIITADTMMSQKLKPIVDVNVGLEYRYSKILSTFINFDNVAALKYYRWRNYPMQRFHVLGGLTYSF